MTGAPDDIQHWNNVHPKTSPISYTVMGCCWPMYTVTGTYIHTMTENTGTRNKVHSVKSILNYWTNVARFYSLLTFHRTHKNTPSKQKSLIDAQTRKYSAPAANSVYRHWLFTVARVQSILCLKSTNALTWISNVLMISDKVKLNLSHKIFYQCI